MKTRRNQYQQEPQPKQPILKPNVPRQKSPILIPNVPSQRQSQEIKTSEAANELTNKLKLLYEDIKSTPSFTAKINQFLRSNEIHSKYKQIVKRKFPRRKVIARFPFELFMADLFEYPQYKYQNRGYVYGLVLIDCFTKYVWIKPMKTKTGQETSKAFESIFQEFDQHPLNLVTDAGLEFFNSKVNQVLNSYNIVHYKPPTKTEWKASMAERVIQTFKRKLEKYFHKYKTKKWTDVIDQIVKDYNNTPHSAHGLKPVDVTDENRDVVYKKMFPDRNLSVVCKLYVGDRVRKIREKTLYEKGYTQNWSDEVYIIETVRQSGGVCWYQLIDSNHESVPGIWYYYQLNLVSRNVGEHQGHS